MTFGAPPGPSLSAGEFRSLRDLLYEHCGIFFREEMAFLMERRLRARLTALSLASFDGYYRHLRWHPEGRVELEAAVELLTTNETYFFREPNQLRAFSEEVLPALAIQNAATRRLHVWSAGCSTGEECYTLAILLREAEALAGWRLEVHGSDISRKVVAAAKRAEYGASSLRATSEELQRRHFKLSSGRFVPRDEIRALVTFGQGNLLDEGDPGAPPEVDAIFCRNVIIYFDAKAKKRVLATFHRRLAPGGYLFLGHSESLINVTADFELVHLRNDVAYRKPPSAEDGA
ncbi:MAG: CheR family methyltransferase [Myxococcales bacterium]